MNRSTFIEGALSVAIALILVYMVVEPYFEARAFNNCTHGHATYWDALVLDLRVTDCK